MSKSYTPGLKILEQTLIEKERILPLRGKVHVNQGDIVEPDDVVASTEIPGNVQMVNIANELNIDPDQISDCMLCSVDEQIYKGQVIARSKGLFGLFKSEVKAPLDGMISKISNVTGQIIITEKPFPIKVDAYIPGKINKTINDEGVIIKSNGMLIQGIIGVGSEKKGYIQAIENETIEDLNNIENQIIVLQGSLTFKLFNQLTNLGVKGVICGSVDYNTLTKILEKPLGVAITGMEKTITIVVTEGFGAVLMANRTYQLLSNNNGKFASINGATQIRAGVMRPEIFIGSNINVDSSKPFSEDDLVISINSKVRIIREPYFGKIGKVVGLPSELIQIDTETMARVAEIDFDEGEKKIIPRTNLEVIIS